MVILLKTFHKRKSIDFCGIVVHPVECVSCGRTRFSGLRYQCTKCPSAWSHQCQECFWRGLSFSDAHQAEHEIREHHTPVR